MWRSFVFVCLPQHIADVAAQLSPVGRQGAATLAEPFCTWLRAQEFAALAETCGLGIQQTPSNLLFSTPAAGGLSLAWMHLNAGCRQKQGRQHNIQVAVTSVGAAHCLCFARSDLSGTCLDSLDCCVAVAVAVLRAVVCMTTVTAQHTSGMRKKGQSAPKFGLYTSIGRECNKRAVLPASHVPMGKDQGGLVGLFVLVGWRPTASDRASLAFPFLLLLHGWCDRGKTHSLDS